MKTCRANVLLLALLVLDYAPPVFLYTVGSFFAGYYGTDAGAHLLAAWLISR